MPYTEDQRRFIIKGFLDWCDRVGYTSPDHPVEIDIVQGIPIGAKRVLQSVRFDVDGLTKRQQNTTMD